MNVIVKYITPVATYTIDEEFYVYVNNARDYNFTADSLKAAITYIEDKISSDIISNADGIRAQINQLTRQLDSLQTFNTATEYRIKL